MPRPPVFNIDPDSFWADPYPIYRQMRASAPVAFVPQLGAILFIGRDDIFTCEKNVEVFSSFQPDGLMTRLMGENMMRRDGTAHLEARKQLFPAVSPKTVRDVWRNSFAHAADDILDELEASRDADLVRDYAMPVSARALKSITGLVQMTDAEMDGASQGMIDGCANYGGDPAIEARCRAATGLIDEHIDRMLRQPDAAPQHSAIVVLEKAGQPLCDIRANIKLIISGGQNEPRDAIAGAVWSLLAHREQLELVQSGAATWLQVFEEYARWMSPIGMSPRRVAQKFTWKGVDFEPEDRVFFMFASANRDESVFDHPDFFDITRDTAKSIAFGAGPHFCAGAAAARCLVADVALPKLFERFPELRLAGDVPFGGWAFRGPLKVPVTLRG